MIRKCGSLDFWMKFGKVPFPNILSILGLLLHFFLEAIMQIVSSCDSKNSEMGVATLQLQG